MSDDPSGELRKGDVIEEVNQQPVTSVAEYRKVLASLDPNGTHVLSVCRRRTRSFVVLRAADRHRLRLQRFSLGEDARAQAARSESHCEVNNRRRSMV